MLTSVRIFSSPPLGWHWVFRPTHSASSLPHKCLNQARFLWEGFWPLHQKFVFRLTHLFPQIFISILHSEFSSSTNKLKRFRYLIRLPPFWRFPGYIPLGGDPKADPKLTGVIIHPPWTGILGDTEVSYCCLFSTWLWMSSRNRMVKETRFPKSNLDFDFNPGAMCESRLIFKLFLANRQHKHH